MDPFAPHTILVATSAATLLAWRARRRKSLTTAGAVTGAIVGFLLVATGYRGFGLLGMYQLGSMATRYKAHIKAQHDATVAHGSQRGARQVLCVSLVAVGWSLLHVVRYGAEQPLTFAAAVPHGPTHIATAVLAHHATALGDTLASELGMLTSSSSSSTTARRSAHPPRLVVPPFRKVPVGTNGGVTIGGTLWSCVGGALMGVWTVAMDALSGILPNESMGCTTVVVYAALMGAVGSGIDSILGATLQATYFDPETKQVVPSLRQNQQNTHLEHISGWDVLTNEQVNLVSLALTSILGGWVVAPWLWGCLSSYD